MTQEFKQPKLAGLKETLYTLGDLLLFIALGWGLIYIIGEFIK